MLKTPGQRAWLPAPPPPPSKPRPHQVAPPTCILQPPDVTPEAMDLSHRIWNAPHRSGGSLLQGPGARRVCVGGGGGGRPGPSRWDEPEARIDRSQSRGARRAASSAPHLQGRLHLLRAELQLHLQLRQEPVQRLLRGPLLANLVDPGPGLEPRLREGCYIRHWVLLLCAGVARARMCNCSSDHPRVNESQSQPGRARRAQRGDWPAVQRCADGGSVRQQQRVCARRRAGVRYARHGYYSTTAQRAE